jgi:predicted Fe-Mo cluster-binding NifX family protein
MDRPKNCRYVGLSPYVTYYKDKNINAIISGGMGMGAQMKFNQFGINVFSFNGSVQDAITSLLKEELGSIEACKSHGHDDEGCHH